MASKADVMQGTIEYMNTKYGSAAGYVKAIGLTPSEVSQIRLNMLLRAAPRDLLERLSLSGNFSRQSNSPAFFGRRSLTTPSQSMRPQRGPSEIDSIGSSELGERPERRRGLRRSTTSNLSALSRRSKSGPGLETMSKLPEDLIINKM